MPTSYKLFCRSFYLQPPQINKYPNNKCSCKVTVEDCLSINYNYWVYSANHTRNSFYYICIYYTTLRMYILVYSVTKEKHTLHYAHSFNVHTQILNHSTWSYNCCCVFIIYLTFFSFKLVCAIENLLIISVFIGKNLTFKIQFRTRKSEQHTDVNKYDIW